MTRMARSPLAMNIIAVASGVSVYFRATSNPVSAEVPVYAAVGDTVPVAQPIISGADGGYGTVYADDGEVWVHYGTAQPFQLDVSSSMRYDEDTKEPTGFVDPEGIIRTYDEVTSTITLSHASGFIDYYWRGVKTSLVSPWVSTAHGAGDGLFFLMSTDGANFTWGAAVWQFDSIMVAAAKVSSAPAYTFALAETHGLMPHSVHEELHNLLGTYRYSGLGPTAGTYTENTATNVATTPGFDAGVIKDEDLPTTIAATPDGGPYTTMRIGAGGLATFDTAATFPFRSAGSYLLLNNPATGAETVGINNRFYNVYEILIPVCLGTESQKYRRILLQPQVAYTSLAAAQAEDPRSLSLGDLALAAAEFVVRTRITFKTSAGDANTGKCRIATGGITIISGSRASIVSSAAGVAPTAENIPTNDEYLQVQASIDARLEIEANITARAADFNSSAVVKSGNIQAATAALTCTLETYTARSEGFQFAVNAIGGAVTFAGTFVGQGGFTVLAQGSVAYVLRGAASWYVFGVTA